MNDIIEDKESIIDDFMTIYRKRDPTLELEIVFSQTYFNIFKFINSLDKEGNSYFHANRYLEFQARISKTEKDRARLNENYFYKQNIRSIKNEILRKGEQIIKKTQVPDLSIAKKTYRIQSASELSVFNLFETKDNLLFFVTSFQRKTSNFIIDIKMKTRINENIKNNIHESFFDVRNKRIITIEIELIEKDHSENELRKELNTIICRLFSKKLNERVILYSSEFEEILKINTLSLNFSNIETYINKNIFLTKKVDGTSVKFIVKNQIITIFILGYYHEFKCNIHPKYTIYGYGEYVRHKSGLRELFPYYIVKATYRDQEIDLSTKKKHFEFIDIFTKENNINNESYYSRNKAISDTEKECVSIVRKNIYGPFNSYEDILLNIAKLYVSNVGYPTDGLILFQEKLDEDDRKIKIDNTIDILAIYEPNTQNKNNTIFKLYTTTKRQLNFFKNITIENCNYDHQKGCIIYNNCYLPIAFIIEYSLKDDKLIKIREDKTVYYLDNYYLGNDESFIKEVQATLQEQITKEYLRTINEDNVGAFVERLKSLRSIIPLNEPVRDYIYEPLNMNKKWYKEDIGNRKRVNFNFLSNLVKSHLIYYGSNKMANVHLQNRRPAIFDLNSGPGTDLFKFKLSYASYVFCTDPDSSALTHAQSRHKSMLRDNNSIFKFLTYTTAIEIKTFINDCFKTLKENKFPTKFEYINIGFSFHFFFNGIIKERYFEFLDKFAKSNAIIGITTNNGDEIENILKSENEILFNHDDHYIKITKNSNNTINYFNTLSMSEPNQEYLIFKNDVISQHRENGYELIFSESFDYFIHDSEYFINLSLLNSKRKASDSGEKFLKSLQFLDNEMTIKMAKLYRCYLFFKK